MVSCQQAPFKLTSVLLICNLYWQLATGNWQLVLPMREVVSTKDAPQAIGPYSQAIKANGFVFVSGQVAIDLSTQQVVTGDVAAQTDRVLRNLSAILEAAGSGFGKVVRSTVFLKNERLCRHEPGLRQVFQFRAAGSLHRRSGALPKDVLVEIDVIALA